MTDHTAASPVSAPCRACHVARMLDADLGIGGEYLGEAEVASREEQARRVGSHTCVPAREPNTRFELSLSTPSGVEVWSVAGDSEYDGDVDDDGRSIGSFTFDPVEARGPRGEVVDFATCWRRDPRPGAFEAFEAWCSRFAGDLADPETMKEHLDAKAADADYRRVIASVRQDIGEGSIPF